METVKIKPTAALRSDSVLAKPVDPKLLEQAKIETAEFINLEISKAEVTSAELAAQRRGFYGGKEPVRLDAPDFDVLQFLDYVFSEWEAFKNGGLTQLGSSELTVRYPHININDAPEIKIVTALIKRELCVSSNRGDRRMYRPFYRGSRKDPEYPDHSIHFFEQWFDNLISFTLTTSSPSDLLPWQSAFEDFLYSNRWKWMRAGLLDFRYEGMIATTDQKGFDMPGKVELQYLSPFIIWCRTKKTSRLVERDLEQFNLKILVAKSNEQQTTT